MVEGAIIRNGLFMTKVIHIATMEGVEELVWSMDLINDRGLE